MEGPLTPARQTAVRYHDAGQRNEGPVALAAAVVERARLDAAGMMPGLHRECDDHLARRCAVHYLTQLGTRLDPRDGTDPIDLAFRVLSA